MLFTGLVLDLFPCRDFMGMESLKYMLVWFFPFPPPLLSIRSTNFPSAVKSLVNFKVADLCK